MLLFATMAGQQLQAKKHPFVMEDKWWVYVGGNRFCLYTIHGDTTINDVVYKKMYRKEKPLDMTRDRKEQSLPEDFVSGEWTFHAAVREEGKKVLAVMAGSESERVVYNFDAREDEVFETLLHPWDVKVDAYTVREFDSSPVVVQDLLFYSSDPNEENVPMTWMRAVEGFGSLFNNFLNLNSPTEEGFQYCYEDGILVATIDDIFELPLYGGLLNDAALVKEGKVWKWQSMNIMSGSRYEYEYFIEGDTLIGGEAYKKLYTLDAYMYKTTEPVYIGALREEGAKVYFVRSGHENVEFLYDFDLPVGGTMHYGHYDATAVARDVITVKGIERKRVKVKEIQTDSDGEGANEGLTGYWVEGICSTSGLLEPAQFDTGLNISKLLAVYEDGKCIFTGEDFYPKKNSFVREGKRWEYEMTNLYYGNRYVYTMQGDTLFDEGSYKKLYLSVNDGKPAYQGAIRERNGKIYMVDKSKSWDDWDMPDFETVLCDFNAQVGDVVFSKEEYGDTYRLTVDRIDEVTVDGNARKRIVMKATTTHEDGSVEERGSMEWVEGIGSTEGFSGPMGIFYDGGLYSHLIACYEYDELIFMQEDFYGRIINGAARTLDESREHELVDYVNLSLENGVVLKSQGDRMVVADRENGSAICLFGLGLEAGEGTELSGTIAGLLCECNDLSTLFPTRSTDLSTVQKGGMAEDLAFDSFTISNLRTDYNYWYKAMNILGARIITTDQGIFVAGDDGQPYLHLNDMFGVLNGISLPMTAQTLFGCFSPRMYRNVSQDSIVPLSVTTGESTGIEDISSHTSPLTSHPSILYDLQGRRVEGNCSLPRGIYIINGKKIIVK